MDVNKEIRLAVTTGKVLLGSDKSIKAIKLAHAKLAILASNCPDTVRADVEHYAKLANIPVYLYPGGSEELGLACGKPFLVAAMVVLDPGNSSILNIGRT